MIGGISTSGTGGYSKPISELGLSAIGEGLFTEAEMSQRQLHHQGPPEHG